MVIVVVPASVTIGTVTEWSLSGEDPPGERVPQPDTTASPEDGSVVRSRSTVLTLQ